MGRERFRVGFIGCGRVAENHFRALSAIPGAELIAVSGGRTRHLEEKSARWGVPMVEDPELLVRREDLDVVFVLTPTETHLKYAELAMSNGKHVLVEKPISYELGEIERLQKLTERYAVSCFPGHSYLYLPEIRRMMRYVARKTPSPLNYFFMSEMYRMPDEYLSKYHGPLREVLCHEIYIMLALLGVPQSVHAFSSSFRSLPGGTDEQVVLNAEYSSGVLAQVVVSWAAEDDTSDPWTFKIKLQGLNGGMHFSRRDVVTRGTPTSTTVDYPLYDEMFVSQDRYYFEDFLVGGEQPLSTLQDARATLMVMLAIEKSIESRTVVRLEEGMR